MTLQFDYLHRGHPPAVKYVQVGARFEQSAKNPRRTRPTSSVRSSVPADAPHVGVGPKAEQNLRHLSILAIGAYEERSLPISIKSLD